MAEIHGSFFSVLIFAVFPHIVILRNFSAASTFPSQDAIKRYEHGRSRRFSSFAESGDFELILEYRPASKMKKNVIPWIRLPRYKCGL